MKEKGTTPSGMSEAGYHQALENFVYFSNKLAKQIAALPGDPMEKVMSMMARGDVYQEFKEQFDQLDRAAQVIAETYGYTEKEVEQHLEEHFQLHIGDFIMESLVEELK